MSFPPLHSLLCSPLLSSWLEFMVYEIPKVSLEKLIPTRFPATSWFEAGALSVTELYPGCSCIGSAFPRAWWSSSLLLPAVTWIANFRKAAHVLVNLCRARWEAGVECRKTELALSGSWRAHALRLIGSFPITFHVNYLTFRIMHLLLGLWLSNISF